MEDPCITDNSSPCLKRVKGSTAYIAAKGNDALFTEDKWDRELDEGLFLEKVDTVATVEDQVFEGRGAGWLDDWELYLRFQNKLADAEDFLSSPDLIESGYITWASAIFRFVTPIKNRPSPQQLLIGNWVPEIEEIE